MFSDHHSYGFPGTGRLLNRFLLAATVIVLLYTACSRKDASSEAAAHGAAHDTLVIAFYNVENLFDLNDDGSEYAEYRPGALGWNKQTWEKKVFNIAAAIAALNADAVGLCEVENKNALEGLRRRLRKLGAAYPYAAMTVTPGRSATRVALISRVPITATRTFGGKRDSVEYRRDILEADLDCGGQGLKLFVNHWPSKKHPESYRYAAARALAERLKNLPPQTDYAVMGDLNADYDEWRKSRTEGLDDTRGVTGINHLLKTSRHESGRFISYVKLEEMACAERLSHCNPWLELPEERRFSYTFQGQWKTPDHILLPRSLFDTAGWSYLEGTFSAFTWNDRLLRNGEPFRWQMKGFGKRRVHAGEGYSDHLPVRAALVRRKACPAVPVDCGSRKRGKEPAAAGGFEKSKEGWVACARGYYLNLDSGKCASGRYCLKIQGSAQEKNRCAARTVLRREAADRGRREKIVFSIRGAGKISIRARSGKGAWRYYNAPSFLPSRSARYQQVRYVSWRRVELPFIYDDTASADLTVELRAGKAMAFCFWLDNVAVR